MAGQIIMQGFVGFKIPIWARRLITMLPALIIAAIGVDPTRTLVLSQVVLSFVLPLPVISLIYFTRRKDLMGSLVNHRATTALAVVCGALILVLNAVLLYQTLGGALPGS
jgi:manganese transport protein